MSNHCFGCFTTENQVNNFFEFSCIHSNFTHTTRSYNFLPNKLFSWLTIRETNTPLSKSPIISKGYTTQHISSIISKGHTIQGIPPTATIESTIIFRHCNASISDFRKQRWHVEILEKQLEIVNFQKPFGFLPHNKIVLSPGEVPHWVLYQS